MRMQAGGVLYTLLVLGVIAVGLALLVGLDRLSFMTAMLIYAACAAVAAVVHAGLGIELPFFDRSRPVNAARCGAASFAVFYGVLLIASKLARNRVRRSGSGELEHRS
jgi:hypothetical protein